MFADVFARVERVLAAITALLLFTLNEVRMFNLLPRAPQPAHGQTVATFLHVAGGSDQVYLSVFDLAARYGLAGLTIGLSAWAVADTLRKRAAA